MRDRMAFLAWVKAEGEDRVKTRLSPIEQLERAEAQVWYDYLEAHREWELLHKFGKKSEIKAKRMRKRALGLNRRHAQIMRRIMFIHRQALYGSTRG